MNDWDRTQPERVLTAKGHPTLAAFLDHLRETVLWKLEGISDPDARRPFVGSGTSLAGIVKHLAFVERFWFQYVFAGRDVEFPWTDDDPDADWRVEAWETVAGLSEFYRSEISVSRAIAASAPLKRRAAHPEYGMSLRWIMAHMISETARHAGHADIGREMIDGATGE